MSGYFTVLNEDVKRFSLRKEVFIVICTRYRSVKQPILLQKDKFCFDDFSIYFELINQPCKMYNKEAGCVIIKLYSYLYLLFHETLYCETIFKFPLKSKRIESLSQQSYCFS